MPKRSYTRRDTSCDRVFGGRYFVEEKSVELLVSTCQDGNMDLRFSDDAESNYRLFLGKYGLDAEDSFSPALGQSYRIITIEDTNEEKFAGKFIGNGDSRDEYRCDAVIVCGANIPVAFRVGDCPVVLVVGQSFEGQIVLALVHAGRAELQAEILKNAVARMVSDFRIHLLSATAYVFPHICKRCYSLQYVDPDTEKKAGNFLEFSNGRYHLDLMGWLRHQLEEAGIRRVSTVHFRCTAGISPVCVSRLLHDMKKFKGLFSHYKSFHLGAPKGRFVIVARVIERSGEVDKEEGDFYET
ncbi:MAG: laccase domain-containing protein [Parcubacteria group bacterium]